MDYGSSERRVRPCAALCIQPPDCAAPGCSIGFGHTCIECEVACPGGMAPEGAGFMVFCREDILAEYECCAFRHVFPQRNPAPAFGDGPGFGKRAPAGLWMLRLMIPDHRMNHAPDGQAESGKPEQPVPTPGPVDGLDQSQPGQCTDETDETKAGQQRGQRQQRRGRKDGNERDQQRGCDDPGLCGKQAERDNKTCRKGPRPVPATRYRARAAPRPPETRARS